MIKRMVLSIECEIEDLDGCLDEEAEELSILRVLRRVVDGTFALVALSGCRFNVVDEVERTIGGISFLT